MMERKTIGIDLGHCEATATFPEQIKTGQYKVERLSLLSDKEKIIPTQIILTNKQMQKLKGWPRPTYALLQDLELQIGEDLPADASDGELFCYFKTAPQNFDRLYANSGCAKEYGITYGMLMACFVFSLVNNLLKLNDNYFDASDRKNIDLLIGCPSTSDWTASDAKKEYAALVKAATNVHHVRIVPESRAAMFSSVENRLGLVSALDGALVFDFGSSTVDCTYMLLGRKLLEFSWNLGAAKIEQQIVQNTYQKAMEEKGSFSPTPTSYAESMNYVRRAKENYYSKKKQPPIFCDFKKMEDGSDVFVAVQLDAQYMKRVTEENKISIRCDSRNTRSGSWKKLCRDFFREAARQVEKAEYYVMERGKKKRVPCGVKSIVLTGGASRMDFIYELCQETFPDAHIYRETNPSYTVSNGLAWVAVSDENLPVCKEAALYEVTSNHECDVTALQDKLSDKLFELVVETVEEQAKAWANRPEAEVPLKVLQDDLAAAMDSIRFRNRMKNIYNIQIGRWKSVLSDSMELAVNKQVGMLFSEQVAHSLMIPDDIWQELQADRLAANQIDVGDALKNIDMSPIIVKTIKEVVQIIWAIISIVLALVTLGVGGLLAEPGYDLSERLMADHDPDKPRDKKIRARVAKEIKSRMQEKKAEIIKGFNESLGQQMEGYSDIVDKTLTAAFEIVTLRRFGV